MIVFLKLREYHSIPLINMLTFEDFMDLAEAGMSGFRSKESLQINGGKILRYCVLSGGNIEVKWSIDIHLMSAVMSYDRDSAHCIMPFRCSYKGLVTRTRINGERGIGMTKRAHSLARSQRGPRACRCKEISPSCYECCRRSHSLWRCSSKQKRWGRWWAL